MAFTDNLLTRFPAGVSGLPATDIFSSIRGTDWTKAYVFTDDFPVLDSQWIVTETQAGATQAVTAGNYGLVLLTNSAAANDVNQLQLAVGSFLPALNSNKRLFLKARFAISDVSDSAFAIGLQVVNADGTVLANATQGMYFLKAVGAATIDFYVRQANVAANSVNAGAIATLVNATQVEVAAFFDGVDRVFYAINGVVLGSVLIAAASVPNAVLAPIITLKNGAAAVARTATIDSIFVALER